jgi:hypothetical protein
MFIVATTSKGDTNVRETTPAMAPAARNFMFLAVAVVAQAGTLSLNNPLKTLRSTTLTDPSCGALLSSLFDDAKTKDARRRLGRLPND